MMDKGRMKQDENSCCGRPVGQLTPQLALHYTVYSIWEMKAWCEFTYSMLAQKLFLEKAVFRQKVK